MNKKILNTHPETAKDGTKMKSKLEVRIYETLQKMGIQPAYEGEVFTYWTGIRPTVPFYDKSKTGHNRLNMKKLISMNYTPDFVFIYKGTKVIIEVKGFENDQFPIRKKLFRAFLETLDYPVVYAEIFTKRQLLEFMNTLNNQQEC